MVSVQVVRTVHGAVLLIIRRSWVRAPPAHLRFYGSSSPSRGPVRGRIRHPEAKPEAVHAPHPANCIPGQAETPAPERIHQVERAARLDQMQARTDETVTRIVGQRAELTGSSEYTARIEREAQAEPEPDVQAETAYEIELEL